MMRRFAVAAAILLFFGMGRVASAHRLDEYLQATLLTVRQDQVDGSMRLIPGVAVSSSVIASIDTDNDGVFSAVEQQRYAQRVLNDLTISADGTVIKPKLISASFPQIQEMRDGLGEIHIRFVVPLPRGTTHRSLTIENHHQNPSSVYLVNATVPEDPNIHILAQKRNEQQSTYELDYEQSGAGADGGANTAWSNLRVHINAIAFITLFELGMRHIAEGTDHLLFLLALLLPSLLIASGSRWVSSPKIRPGLLRVLKIVTAFTVGHSITLALAALGFVNVPGRPIEVLIAVSILVSAIHALRPIFPGKEAAIAAFFGLIHGLAFASTLNSLGLGWWERLTGILAFNLGIETMQLLVVAVALPSLILMSGTNAYRYVRVIGATFAVFASLGWIAERLLNLKTPVDAIVNGVAHRGPVIAGAFFVISVACWRVSGSREVRAEYGSHLICRESEIDYSLQ